MPLRSAEKGRQVSHPEGLADGMGGGRAGSGDGVGRALDAEGHGDVAGPRIGHAERDGQRVDAVAIVDEKLAIAGLLRHAPADAGAGDDGALRSTVSVNRRISRNG